MLDDFDERLEAELACLDAPRNLVLEEEQEERNEDMALEAKITLKGQTWADLEFAAEVVLEEIRKQVVSGYNQNETGSYHLEVNGEEEEYLLDAEVAPFPVKELDNGRSGFGRYQARLTDITEYIKNWSSGRVTDVDYRSIYSWFFSIGIPFDPESHRVITNGLEKLVEWEKDEAVFTPNPFRDAYLP